jgi:hypothetical protein
MFRVIFLLETITFSQPVAKRIVLPSGEMGYSIRCDNENINACYERAGDICHRGYTIQNINTQVGNESSSDAYVGPGVIPGTALGVASSSSKTTSEKGFLIQCKEPVATEYDRSQKIRNQEESDKKREKMKAADHREASRTFFTVIGCLMVGMILFAVVVRK